MTESEQAGTVRSAERGPGQGNEGSAPYAVPHDK